MYQISVVVKEIIYGNTVVDKITGWDQVQFTTLKLRCTDCTVMVFKSDIINFKNVSQGFEFKAEAKEWRNNVFNFKKILDN